ncbi:hypothetical protein KHP62_18175 [Rhodobacteraceae bacterium NNCM2]|nr:hypothetical protein [Coraliihabitans acroporae]
MIRMLALLAIVMPAIAQACPAPSETVLFHSCWGNAQASSLLLPEESPVPKAPDERLVVTGGYTGKDVRHEERPNPVGMFVHKGQVINPNLARMDGVVIVSSDGDLDVQHRKRTGIGTARFDLTEIPQREAFQAVAAQTGATVFQSHLLIVDSKLDIRPPENPKFAVRRILFTDETGYGIYQTRDPVSLYDAAVEVEEAMFPTMAINLDMGSYDYCLATRSGVEINCGVLGRENTQKLSNLLVLRLQPRG